MPSIQTLRREILARIRTALDRSHSSQAPIRLENVADEFQIQRIPRISQKIRQATIEFDASIQRFVISLHPAWRPIEQARDGSDLLLSRALRFTYAHEFAHRFLFLPRRSSWVRALALVVQEYPVAARLPVVTSLSRVEEQLCNQVAGRLLVPSDQLDALLPEFVARHASTPHFAWELINLIARHFDVTRQCALTRLAAEPTVTLRKALGPSFFFMLVTETAATGAGQGRTTNRVIGAWSPERVGKQGLGRIYPGFPVDKFGKAFSDSIQLAKAAEALPVTEVEIQLVLPSRHRGSVKARFRGWRRVWGYDPTLHWAFYGALSSAD